MQDCVYEHELEKESRVLEIGGYLGQWASDMYGRYACKIVSCEPVPRFAIAMRRRFAKNPDIMVREVAVGGRAGNMLLSGAADEVSAFRRSAGPGAEAKVIDVVDLLATEGLVEVDLLCMNCEGAEYDILERLISSGNLTRVKTLQVQFHDFVAGGRQRRQALVGQIAKTHRPLYSAPFVWEAWQRR